MYASHGMGMLSLRQGDLSRVLPLLERAVGICHETDLSAYFPWMAATLGAAYALGGRGADAVALLTQSLRLPSPHLSYSPALRRGGQYGSCRASWLGVSAIEGKENPWTSTHSSSASPR
jgi:hypothetical protein